MKHLSLAICIFLTSSCAFFAAGNMYTDVYHDLMRENVYTNEALEEYSIKITHLPYINCWPQFLPIPMPLITEENIETIYGIKGTRVSCPFNEMEGEAAKSRTPYLHKYFIVEPNNKKGGFSNWGALEGSRVIEAGTIMTMDLKRSGVIVSYKDNLKYGVFVFEAGMIKKYSPFALKIDEKYIEGKFGKKELTVKKQDGSIFTWFPVTDDEIKSIANLIPAKYRHQNGQ